MLALQPWLGEELVGRGLNILYIRKNCKGGHRVVFLDNIQVQLDKFSGLVGFSEETSTSCIKFRQ